MTARRMFAMVRTIGTGAQGTVWEARSPAGDLIAYKVYKPDPDSKNAQTDRERFAKEIATQSKLSHSHIVPVIEDGTDVNGDPFYVMGLADGSLQTRIGQGKGGLPRDDALSIFQKVCEAMAYAHAEGVVHRDLKPPNILMYGDEPRVADFGLGRDMTSMSATYSQSKVAHGTVGYMAPEQYDQLHAAEMPADVYALGKILYVMLTGGNPLAVDLDKVPDDLKFVIHTCLQDKPADRYSDCTELLQRFTAAVGANASLLAPPTDQAKAAVSAYQGGEVAALSTLVDICLSYPDDSALYVNQIPSLPRKVLQAIATAFPAKAKTIASNFDVYAADNDVFAFADTIADFYDPLFQGTNDVGMRQDILNRLLDQGYRNNRFHVGDVFARLCATVWGQPFYSQMIAELLRKYPKKKGFFADSLNKYSMPPVVKAALDE